MIRVAKFCGFSVLAVFLVAGCVLGTIYFLDERRANALLNDVRTLRVGESTPSDVQRIVQKYGSDKGEAVTYTNSGCPSGEGVSYWVNLGHKFLINWGLAEMRICRAPADDEQCLGVNQPKDFESPPGITVGNRSQHQSCAERARENESEAPANAPRIRRNREIEGTRHQKEPEPPLRMKRL
jgi:hypothetical protein